MKNFKNKLKQIIKFSPVLIISAAGYISTAIYLSKIEHSLLKGLVFALFLISFSVLCGTILYLADLHIGEKYNNK